MTNRKPASATSAQPSPPVPESATGQKPPQVHTPTDDERRFVDAMYVAEGKHKVRFGVAGQLKCILIQGVRAKLIATSEDKAFALGLAKKHNVTRTF